MKYKVVIKQISTGFVRSRVMILGQRQVLQFMEKVNVVNGDFVVLDIVEID